MASLWWERGLDASDSSTFPTTVGLLASPRHLVFSGLLSTSASVIVLSRVG